MYRPLSRVAPLVAVLLLAASAAAAQEIRGTVRDGSNGQPLAGTLLVALDADSAVRATTLSDSGGTFLLRAPPDDTIRLRAMRLGYATLESVPFSLEGRDSLRLEIHLRPRAVALEGLTVTAPRSENYRDFLSRQRSGFGIYLGPEEIARMPQVGTTNLLASIPGVGLIPDIAARNGLRGKPLGAGGFSCDPTVYVDGHEVVGSLEANAPLSSIRGIEIYRDPVHAPLDLPRVHGACMVVVIWTELGFRW